MEKQKLYVFFCLFVLSCMLLLSGVPSQGTAHAGRTADGTGEKLINVSSHGEQLQDILVKISNQTGYQVEISESLLDYKVTGRYENVALDSFLRRIFKGMNVFQVIDNDSRTVKIYSSLRGDEKTVVLAPYAGARGYVLDGEKDKTLEDLLEARDTFYEQVDASTIPLDETGITPGELQRKKEEYYQRVDVDSIPLEAKTNTSPGSLQQAREKYFQTADVDAMQLDQDTSQSLGELKEKRDKFYQSVDAGDIPLEKGSTVTPNSLRRDLPGQVEK